MMILMIYRVHPLDLQTLDDLLVSRLDAKPTNEKSNACLLVPFIILNLRSIFLPCFLFIQRTSL